MSTVLWKQVLLPGSSSPKQQQAAIRIQAAGRRKLLQNDARRGRAANAATKIQALMRGKQVRKSLSEKSLTAVQ